MKRVLALGAGLLAGLLVVEIALRLAGVACPRTMDIDSELGRVRHPGFCWEQSDEGHARVCINSLGFRDPEWTERPSGNRMRIALAGDSFIEAVQVDTASRIGNILERMLNARGGPDGRPVEVMNCAASGFGTAQEWLAYRRIIRPLSPDLVLLAFTTGNDVLDNTYATSRDPDRPYFEIAGGRLARTRLTGWRVRVKSIRDRLLAHLLDVSRVAQMCMRAHSILAERRHEALLHRTSEGAGPTAALELGLSPLTFRAPSTPVMTTAWSVTEALLARFADDVRADGAEFRVLLLGSGVEVHPDSAARARFCSDLGIQAPGYTADRIEAFCRDRGIPVLPLNRIMADSALATGTFYHGFPNTLPAHGHWNESGHALAAAETARWLLER